MSLSGEWHLKVIPLWKIRTNVKVDVWITQTTWRLKTLQKIITKKWYLEAGVSLGVKDKQEEDVLFGGSGQLVPPNRRPLAR